MNSIIQNEPNPIFTSCGEARFIHLRATVACIVACFAICDQAFAQQPPITTTTEAVGIEDGDTDDPIGTSIVVTLDGEDPIDPGANLIATIRQLPARGSLEQMDGTPIDSVPTDVTDPARQVVFRVPPHGSGMPYADFYYSLTHPSDDRRSAWGRVDVNVTPVADRPLAYWQAFSSNFLEGQPAYFRCAGSDGDQDDLIFFFSNMPPSGLGSFYQLDDDNVTPGELIEQFTVISNPRGWVLFQPAPDFAGSFQTVLFSRDTPMDGDGLFSFPHLRTFTVNAVNDGPVAAPQTHTAPSNLPSMSVVLEVNDPELDLISGAITRLPTRGDLYRGGIITEANRITAASPEFEGRQLAYVRHDPTAFGDPFDTFSYVASDGAFGTVNTTDTIVINPVGGYPLPDPVDEYVVAPDNPEGITFSLQPIVIDYPLTNLHVEITSIPEHGLLTLVPPSTSIAIPLTSPTFIPTNVAGEWRLTYVPDLGFDSFDPTTGELTPDRFVYRLTTNSFPHLTETYPVRFFVHEEGEDIDGDGTADVCPDDPNMTTPGDCGCGMVGTDTDGDGVADCNDGCPDNPNKTEPGICGCDIDDEYAPGCLPTGDSDNDGVPDVDDGCPLDPNKVDPGACGCGVIDADADGDGVPFCLDGCPGNPFLTEPGVNGCDSSGIDTDGDGVADDQDACPNDPNKWDTQGHCGCGEADVDTDGDGEFDCYDQCPDDPNKTRPGILGCGVPDTDTDGDGVVDAFDNCPNDPFKVAPGDCGCGEIESADSDGDGMPDCVDVCPTRRLGDVSGDGLVDVADAASLATILLDPAAVSADDFCAADANGDAVVNGLDVQEFIAQLLDG